MIIALYIIIFLQVSLMLLIMNVTKKKTPNVVNRILITYDNKNRECHYNSNIDDNLSMDLLNRSITLLEKRKQDTCVELNQSTHHR